MLRVTPLILEAEAYELGEFTAPHTHAYSGITRQHNLNGAAIDKHLQVKDVNDLFGSVSLTQATRIGEMLMELAIVGTARLLISPFLAPLSFTGCFHHQLHKHQSSLDQLPLAGYQSPPSSI